MRVKMDMPKNEVIQQGLYGVFIMSDDVNWEKNAIDRYGFNTQLEAEQFARKNSSGSSKILVYTYVTRLGSLCLIPLEGGDGNEL